MGEIPAPPLYDTLQGPKEEGREYPEPMCLCCTTAVVVKMQLISLTKPELHV